MSRQILTTIFVLLTMSSVQQTISANEQVVTHVNELRSRHSAAPITWTRFLEESSNKWSKQLAASNSFEHSNTIYGENLAWLYGTNPIIDSVDMWYSEEQLYNYEKGGFSAETGHFTQIVWNGTREIGASAVKGRDGMWIVTMQFNPPGNMIGLFRENVFPKSFASSLPPKPPTPKASPAYKNSPPPPPIPLSSSQKQLIVSTLIGCIALAMSLVKSV